MEIGEEMNTTEDKSVHKSKWILVVQNDIFNVFQSLKSEDN